MYKDTQCRRAAVHALECLVGCVWNVSELTEVVHGVQGHPAIWTRPCTPQAQARPGQLSGIVEFSSKAMVFMKFDQNQADLMIRIDLNQTDRFLFFVMVPHMKIIDLS